MKKYIAIHNYNNGAGIPEQLNTILEAGEFTEDTRLFFPKREHISMWVITHMLYQFEIEFDDSFAEDNSVFKPREWVLESIAKGDGKFKFHKWG